MTINTTNAKVLKARKRMSRSDFGHRKLVVECAVCGGRKRFRSPSNLCEACKYLLNQGSFDEKLQAMVTNRQVVRRRKFRRRKFAQPLPVKQYKSVFRAYVPTVEVQGIPIVVGQDQWDELLATNDGGNWSTFQPNGGE